MQIRMEPQSSQVLPPKTEQGVTQLIVLNNPNKVILWHHFRSIKEFLMIFFNLLKEPIRLRYKVSYEQFGVEMEQTGDYHA